jgi:probable rRNA maturation factor
MIEIINQQHRHKINIHRFRRLLDSLVKHYELDSPEIVLAFVNNKAIQELNVKFLKTNRPTDVLSFPLGEKGPDGKYYLGDIIISVPEANKNAAEKKHSLERELEVLTVHGFLHLLGFEHLEGMEEEEQKMRAFLFKGKNGN